MLYLTCTMVFSVDIAHYGVPRAKDWVFVDCGTNSSYCINLSSKRLNTKRKEIQRENDIL